MIAAARPRPPRGPAPPPARSVARQDRPARGSRRSSASSFATSTIVLCHGAFDLVHMGHLIHFEEAPRPGRPARRDRSPADKHITKKRVGLVQRGLSGRGRWRRSRSSTTSPSSTSRPRSPRSRRSGRTSTSRGPSTRTCCSTRRRTSSHEKTLVESYGGRIHFTTGETFSSTKLSHFLLSSTGGRRRTIRCSATIGSCSATCRASASRSRSVKAFLARREPAPRLPARRNDHRRVGRRLGHQHLAEVALRGGTGNRPRAADRRRPASSRCTWPSFVKQRRLLHQRSGCGRGAGERHGDAARRQPARQDAVRRQEHAAPRSSSRS